LGLIISGNYIDFTRCGQGAELEDETDGHSNWAYRDHLIAAIWFPQDAGNAGVHFRLMRERN